MRNKIKMLVPTALLALCGCIGSGSISGMVASQAGYFPQLTGIDLLGQERNLPQDFAGRLNLVVVAFERDQQVEIDSWIEHFLNKMEQQYPDLRLYEIPLIYRINGAYRFWINNGMRAAIPDPAARERTITVYTDRDSFLSLMNMDTGSIYALLLDSDGQIRWRGQGVATPENQAELAKALEQVWQ